MFLDAVLVVICHFITANVALLTKKEPKSDSKAVRICASITILVGAFAIIDMAIKGLTHRL